ncbi:MAG: DUF427 domain-containing protein [Microthrixaceae bacterium]
MTDQRPAAEGVAPGTAVPSPVGNGHAVACPRRVRGLLEGETFVDTRSAWYGWEHPWYPQFHIPDADIDTGRLAATGESVSNALGRFELHDLVAAAGKKPAAARQLLEPAGELPAGMWFVEWTALDAWYEEDEPVYSHPRSPYVRVDAIRASRALDVRFGDMVIAEANSVVEVFETGLPVRHYFDPTAVNWATLSPSETTAVCPYKGFTSGYWTMTEDDQRRDVAWSYGFPTRELAPIAGLVCFDDSIVEITEREPG